MWKQAELLPSLRITPKLDSLEPSGMSETNHKTPNATYQYVSNRICVNQSQALGVG
jgi:hypothetical protein